MHDVRRRRRRVVLIKEVSEAVGTRVAWTMSVAGGVALVKEVSEAVRTQVMWTMTCVVDAGRMALVK